MKNTLGAHLDLMHAKRGLTPEKRDANIDGWNGCKAAMLAKINDENFLFDLRDADLSGIGSTSIIAEAMRKLVNSL